jgi:predicted transcriptional regulator
MTHVSPSLDAVEFLSRSENRVRALATLADRSCDRAELAEAVGVSRVTAQRILDAFERRGWVVADGRTYRATAVGEVVSESFAALLDTMEAAERLAAVEPFLPAGFDVDLRRLTDARVTLPAPGDPLGPVRRSTALMREAEAVRGLGTGIAPDALRANRDAVVDGGQSFEVVFSGGVLDVVAADARMAGWMREMLDAGATVYRHDSVDLLLAEFDGAVVALGVADASGVPRGMIESADAELRTWFETTFERYRDEAAPVTAEPFEL